MRRCFVSLAVTVLALVALPSTAWAVGTITVTNEGTEVQFDAAAGDANVITATTAPGTITITDTGANITEAEGDCLGDATPTVTCTLETLENFELNLGDMDDHATGSGPLSGEYFGQDGLDTLTGSNENTIGDTVEGGIGNDILNTGNVGQSPEPEFSIGDVASGGDGEDVVTSGNGVDQIFGEAGTDILNSGAGPDSLSGGEGDGDQVSAGEGDDFVETFGADGTGDIQDGGPGIDELEAFDSTFDGGGAVFDAFAFNLTAGTFSKTNNDPPPNSDTATNFEDVDSDSGSDNATGTNGSNVFFVSAGNDVVTPLAGADTLDLWLGDDSADTRDGFSDRVMCGPGNDSIQADQFDELSDCETTTITPQRAAGADVDPPGCELRGARNRYKPRAFFRGFRVRVTCDEAVTVTLRVIVRVRRARRVVTSRARDLVLAELTLGLATGTRSARLRPAKALRRALGKRFRARVVADARDEYGNRRTLSKRVRVR